MKINILFLLFFLPLASIAQNQLQGTVLGEQSKPMAYATAALLQPKDSTLAYFGITNEEGSFEIKNINPGEYLLQISFLGYKSLYRSLNIPLKNGSDMGTLVMIPNSKNLNEAEINAEKIPLLLKKDTIEYNAGSFKTKPDANVEELLKKMPGLEVDKSGNIKANGKDVKKVMVNGKEFFGNDPKIATRNLPADAVNKVQMYDKKSDDAEISGIDDGIRDRTLNLQLKDGKDKSWFGDVSSGIATGNHFQENLRLYRVATKSQFAALGMFNNINQFGFSFQDYLNFSGGVHGLMGGDGSGRITIGDNQSIPVDFGQPVKGNVTNGAAGLNYTYEPRKDKRFNISYLGDGADKKLNERIESTNYTENSSFNKDKSNTEEDQTRNHQFNLLFRNKIDSTQRFISNGGMSFRKNSSLSRYVETASSGNSLIGTQNNHSDDNSSDISGNIHLSYLKITSGFWRLFKIKGDATGNQNLNPTKWDNLTTIANPSSSNFTSQYQNNKNNLYTYSVNASGTHRLNNLWYVNPEFTWGGAMESFSRLQGIPPVNDNEIDSLSPNYTRINQWEKPGISLKRNTEKVKLNINLKMEIGQMQHGFTNTPLTSSQYMFLLPGFSLNNDYTNSSRISFYYASQVNTANISQLLPTLNNFNPFQLFHGNPNLKPEYQHAFECSWLFFDQFSFTNLFAALDFNYTKDKINYSRNIDKNLVQSISLINVPDDYNAGANMNFSTPIRKIKTNIHLSARENYNRGINFVNNIQNINTNLTHTLSLSFDNRKKDKIDASIGAKIKYTNARYSIQNSLNKDYFNLNYFCDIHYTPTDRWFFSINADVTTYNAESFNQALNIPLLHADITRYMMKGNRLILSLQAFDLLNKNTGYQRTSALNYLEQTQTNIIQRYFMLTLKFRFNKYEAKGGNGIQIKINRN